MSYILLVDDEPDILEILEMGVLSSFPSSKLEFAKSGNEALKIVQDKGPPLVIVSDYKMADGNGEYLYLELQKINNPSPFIICSGNPMNEIQAKFPDIYGHIEKPRIIEPLKDLLNSIIKKSETPVKYIPIRISFLLKQGEIKYDLYLKLSDTKYLKVMNQGEAFTQADSDRFQSKNLTHLFFSSQDSAAYLKCIEDQLTLLLNNKDVDGDELFSITMENIGPIRKLAMAIGWTQEVVDASKKIVSIAINTISKDKKIKELLERKLKSVDSDYNKHISYLTILSCVLCDELGWTSDASKLKLSMVAILHDISLDESYYQDSEEWIRRAMDPRDKTPEVIKYRNHPVDSASLLQSFKNLPPDIDQIILQHHETPQGTGFPRKLTSQRISPMSCLFIIVEDFTKFIIENNENYEGIISKFIALRDEYYSTGNFRKVFEAFKHKIIN
ncbi:MAG: HD domain-containing phosphohydrolase [Bacteriovoracaceae bacterium]